jgi:hypothetical protein
MKRMKISLAVACAVVGATAAIANATAAGTSNPNVLNGVYRISWTQKQLIAAGASASYAKNNSSVITMTMRGGQFVQRWSEPPGCAGTYAVSGHTVSFLAIHHCHGLVVARWSLAAGQLLLHVTKATDPGDRFLWGSKPWKKIG